MAGLGDPETLVGLESFLGVVVHGNVGVSLEQVAEEHETADNGAGAALAVVAVDCYDPALIVVEEVHHLGADVEQHFERGGLMVLPVVGVDVGQLALVDFPATEVHDHVVWAVVFNKEVADVVDGVAVDLLDAGGGEGHGNEPGGDVGEV